ncbi:hypothetical protein ACFWNK_37665 [Streptomyces sp. NPDC058417]|uniref:hypothetical protein n=1 Tax=unclassified Streptomyces TaxID=2593676 RepID=UPI003648BEB3
MPLSKIENGTDGHGSATTATELEKRNPAWGAVKGFFLAATAATISAASSIPATRGNLSRHVRAAGLSGLAARDAVKVIEGVVSNNQDESKWPSLCINMAATGGNAVWVAGVAVGSRTVEAAGPGINFIAKSIDVGRKIHQKNPDMPGALLDAGEMLFFSLAGATGNSMLRGAALAIMGAGFACDGLKSGDKAFYGHVAGAAIWAAGTAVEVPWAQSAGSALLSAAELGRITYDLASRNGRDVHESSGPALPVHHGRQLMPQEKTQQTGIASVASLGIQDTPSSGEFRKNASGGGIVPPTVSSGRANSWRSLR